MSTAVLDHSTSAQPEAKLSRRGAEHGSAAGPDANIDLFNRNLIIDHATDRDLRQSIANLQLNPESKAALMRVLSGVNERDTRNRIDQFNTIASAIGRDPELAQKFIKTLLNERDGKSILLNRDINETILLANLAEVARLSAPVEIRDFGKLHASKEDPKLFRELFTAVLNTTADPNEVNQGEHNTCTVTAMQYKLVCEQPSEYVRIVSDLLKSDSKVTLRDGSTVRLSETQKAEALEADLMSNQSGYDPRDIGERLFHAAMMGSKYSSRTDSSTITSFEGKELDGPFTHKGLYEQDTQQRMISLFGAYKRLDVKERVEDSPLTTGVLKKAAMDEIANAVKENSLARFAESGSGYDIKQSVVVALAWNPAGHDHSVHVVNVIGQDDQSIYIRNPWGKGSGDHADGIYRMDKKEFEARLRYALIPDPEGKKMTADKGPKYPSEGGVEGKIEDLPEIITFTRDQNNRAVLQLSTDSGVTMIYPVSFELLRQELGLVKVAPEKSMGIDLEDKEEKLHAQPQPDARVKKRPTILVRKDGKIVPFDPNSDSEEI